MHVNRCLDNEHVAKLSDTKPSKQTTLLGFFGMEEGRVPEKQRLTKPSIQFQLPNLRKIDGVLAQKRILGTNFVVDAFRNGPIPGVEHYFLSHFHSDHYDGLNSSFDWGSIVCSDVTANLVVAVLKVNRSRILTLPFEKWTNIGKSRVMAIDAFQ